MRKIAALLLAAWIGLAHAQAPASQAEVAPVAAALAAGAAKPAVAKIDAVAATESFMSRLQGEARAKSDAYAEGAWVVDPATGEQLWQPNDGSAPMTLEQWEAAQASVAAEEVEDEVAEVLDTDVAEAVDEADEAIAEAQVDAEESDEVEIDQADMSLGGEAVEGDDPEAPAPVAEEVPPAG